MTRRTRRRSGLTLLEVLLVLAILVIVGSTVTIYLLPAQQKANERQALVQINAFETMLTAYHLDVGSYPETLDALRVAPPELGDTNRWGGPYANEDIPLDPWGRPYQYAPSGGATYRLWSWGADGQDGTEDDIIKEKTM